MGAETSVRRRVTPNYAEGYAAPKGLTPRGEMLVAAGLAERVELTRQGYSFGAAVPTASAFTYVNAWPTTRAELILWNGEPSDGKTYIIDRVWMTGITSMAASQPLTLLGQVAATALAIAAPTDNANVIRYNLLAQRTNFDSLARLAVANTAFALTNKWFTLASDTPSPTTNLGASVEKECFGRYLIPPGGTFCLAGLAGTAAGTAICGVEWHEVQLSATS